MVPLPMSEGRQLTKTEKAEYGSSGDKPGEKHLGEVVRPAPGSPGSLFVELTGADDGSGTAEVKIEKTAKGAGNYPDDDDSDDDGNRTERLDGLKRIHAGDKGTYLIFTYTPSQTIQSGQLKFQTPTDWSEPSNSVGTDGYTEFRAGAGSPSLGLIEFDDTDRSAMVEIVSIAPGSTIEIHYGSYPSSDDGSGAHAPAVASPSSQFTISVKGGDSSSNKFKAIKTAKSAPIAVRVYSQASGGGNVSASISDSKGDVGAGDTDREVTIVYTAAGEINSGMLKLTIPGKWSNPDKG